MMKYLLVAGTREDELRAAENLVQFLNEQEPKAKILMVSGKDPLPPKRAVVELCSVNLDIVHTDYSYQTKLLGRIRKFSPDTAINLLGVRTMWSDLLTVCSKCESRIAVRSKSNQLAAKLGLDQLDLYTTLLDIEHERDPMLIVNSIKTHLFGESDQITSVSQIQNRKTSPKVAIVASLDFGGAGNAAYRLHRSLVDIGVDSTMLVLVKKTDDPTVKVMPHVYPDGEVVIALNNDAKQRAWMASDKRWRSKLKEYPNRIQFLEMFSDAQSIVRLSQVKEIREADVINFHWIAGMIDYENESEFLADKAVIWTLHDLHAFTGGCHYASGCEGFLKQCGKCPSLGSKREEDWSRENWNIKEDFYKDIDVQVVSPSRWLAGEAQRSSLFSRYPAHVIPYSLPVDVFCPKDREPLRSMLHLKKEHNLILFGAEHVKNKRKGFEYLLKALEQLAVSTKHENLLLGVFGELNEPIPVNDRYKILPFGKISDMERLAAIYAMADVFVLPALEDNLPNTVLESLACGTPVIGFDIGGIPDMVDHKKTGYLATPFKTQSLADGIDWVLGEKAKGINFEQRCRQVAMDRYAPPIQAEAYLQLYNSTLEKMKAKNRSFGIEVG
ncbi:glycosyltransferase family 4 protein [bacterium]|nr:glycosyltransferase family 4 protein [bacterium]